MNKFLVETLKTIIVIVIGSVLVASCVKYDQSEKTESIPKNYHAKCWNSTEVIFEKSFKIGSGQAANIYNGKLYIVNKELNVEIMGFCILEEIK